MVAIHKDGIAKLRCAQYNAWQLHALKCSRPTACMATYAKAYAPTQQSIEVSLLGAAGQPSCSYWGGGGAGKVLLDNLKTNVRA